MLKDKKTSLEIGVLLTLLSIFARNIFCCRITVLYIFIICIFLGRKEKKLLNPYLLFSITPLSLLIYFNFGDKYMVDLTVETWILGIINMMAFLWSLSYTTPFKNINNCKGLPNSDSLAYNAIFLYLLSMGSIVLPQLSSIFWIFSVGSIACAIKSKKRVMYVFALALFLVSAFGVTSKMTMLMYTLTFLVCYERYFVESKASKKMLRLFMTVGVLFMFFAFSFANKDRGHYNAEDGVEYYTTQGISWDYDAQYFMPYMYITNGWTNLQYVSETQDWRTYGLWMVKPILGYLQLDDYFEDFYEIAPYSTFNTLTFITCGFKDFGYWLSVLSALFLGFYIKKIYSRYLISKSPFDIASYALVALATLEMFFSNHFYSQSYPFTILILMELYKYFLSKTGLTVIEYDGKINKR